MKRRLNGKNLAITISIFIEKYESNELFKTCLNNILHQQWILKLL